MKQNKLFRVALLLIALLGGASFSWGQTAIPLEVGSYLTTSTAVPTGTIDTDDNGNLGSIKQTSTPTTATFNLTVAEAQDLVLTFLTGNGNSSNPQVIVALNNGTSDIFTKTENISNSGGWTPVTERHTFDLGNVAAGSYTLKFTFLNSNNDDYVCNLGSIGIYNKAAYIASLDQMPDKVTLTTSKGAAYTATNMYPNSDGVVGYVANGRMATYTFNNTVAGAATLNMGLYYIADGTINVKVIDVATGSEEIDTDVTIDSNVGTSYANKATLLGNLSTGLKVMKFKFNTSDSFLCNYKNVSLSVDASNWKDIDIDLRSGQLGTSGSNMSKYVTVGDTYTYADEEPASYNALLSASSFNGTDHGYVNLKAKVPVEAGIYKITLGTCYLGSAACVKNSDETSTLNVIDVNGQAVQSINQNNGTCYHQNTTKNVVSMWYTASSDETITIVCGNYTPYFAIKKVSSVPELKYAVTYAKGDGVEGTVPDAVDATAGNNITLPVNRTLYKDGYTLTGWNDGTTTYAPGTSYTPTANVTMTAVFTQNTCTFDQTVSEMTVRWDFQRGNGCPLISKEGATAILVQQANVNGNTIDMKLAIDATSGKFANGSFTEWAQVNEGTTFSFPSVEGTTVKAFSMSEPKKNGSDAKSSVDGNEYSNYTSSIATYATTPANNSSTLTVMGGSYYRYIEVTYPANVEPTASYTNTWYFSKSTQEFALEKSAEYVYTVNDHSLTINTDAGKLNNAKRTDEWAQCNNGTLFKVPTYEGAKLTWGKYHSGNTTGFTIGGELYNDYYVVTADETVNMTATGISYLSYIKIEPVTMYEVTGTISGGTINGATIYLTAAGNGEAYAATISDGGFTMKVPADTYTLSLSNSVAYVINSPDQVTVSAAGSIGTVAIAAASPQTVSGEITNAPIEAFTLTFTGTNNSESVDCDAGATSFTAMLAPDTYVISSNVGTLSPLSVESFTVVKDAVTHNIYFPEAAVPAATQQNITVNNNAVVVANVYRTVSDALAAAKAGNISSPIITLTSGQTYREQVIVDMANVTLKTSGTEKSTITFYYGIGYSYYSLNSSGYYDKDRAMTRNSKLMRNPDRWGATVLVRNTGNGFKAENIIFENSFNQYYTAEEVTDGVTPNGVESITYDRTLTSEASGYKAADSRAVTERAAAIGFENNPTGVQLYNCEFRGSQDTFFTSGKIYAKNCNIMGNTDYIFGGGDVVFDDCDLTIGGYSDQEATAYITASNGGTYIFRECTVKPSNRTYIAANLGRDWGGTNANVYYFDLKNELPEGKMSYTWSNMGGAVSAGTANLHIYDFNPTVNANYSSTGSSGANVNGTINDETSTTLYTGVVTRLNFTPEHIYDIPLDENSYHNSIRIQASNNGSGDVTLTRAIAADRWVTVVLPFATTGAQRQAAFGENVKFAKLSGYTSATNTINFASVTADEETVANQPYMVYVSSADSYSGTASFTGVTIETTNMVDGKPTKAIGEDIQFIGTYAPLSTLPAGCYFVSGNNWKKAADSNTISMKGTRAYFVVSPAVSARTLNFSYDNGEATGIADVTSKMEDVRGDYYDLQGRRVAQPTRGLYIVNGKKVVIK